MNPTSSPLLFNYSCISDEEENPDLASIFKLRLVLGGYIIRNSIGAVLLRQRRLLRDSNFGYNATVITRRLNEIYQYVEIFCDTREQEDLFLSSIKCI